MSHKNPASERGKKQFSRPSPAEGIARAKIAGWKPQASSLSRAELAAIVQDVLG